MLQVIDAMGHNGDCQPEHLYRKLAGACKLYCFVLLAWRSLAPKGTNEPSQEPLHNSFAIGPIGSSLLPAVLFSCIFSGSIQPKELHAEE